MLATLLAGLASGETVMMVRRVRRTIAVMAVVGVFSVVALGFLVAAGYLWTARRVGSIEAALIFAAVFFVLAMAVLLFHKVAAASRARRDAERRRAQITAAGVSGALAALPVMTKGKKGLGALAALPVLALGAYGIYRSFARRDRR